MLSVNIHHNHAVSLQRNHCCSISFQRNKTEYLNISLSILKLNCCHCLSASLYEITACLVSTWSWKDAASVSCRTRFQNSILYFYNMTFLLYYKVVYPHEGQ